MKKLATISMAMVLWATAALAGENVSEAMTRLDQAFTAIDKGDHKVALDHLTWCYDKGGTVDPAFMGIRNTYVVDSLAILGETYPPAKEALVTRRDAAMAKVSEPPKISLAFFDVLTLNNALGDAAKNEALLSKCSGNPQIKNFAKVVMSGKNSDQLVSNKAILNNHAERAKMVKAAAADTAKLRIATQEVAMSEAVVTQLQRQLIDATKALEGTLGKLYQARSPELVAKATYESAEVEKIENELTAAERNVISAQQRARLVEAEAKKGEAKKP